MICPECQVEHETVLVGGMTIASCPMVPEGMLYSVDPRYPVVQFNMPETFVWPTRMRPGQVVLSSVPANPTQIVGVPICPDLLRYEQIGEADGWRGRVVRGFFWVMRCWPIHR